MGENILNDDIIENASDDDVNIVNCLNINPKLDDTYSNVQLDEQDE